jgi:hypothetical protein
VPFIVQQLPNWKAGNARDTGWAEVREAQSMTAATLPNVGLSVATEIGESDDVHPANKRDIGKRLALVALERLYGRDYVVRPQISVNVATTISQKVIVQGEVSAPGVYDLKGPTTLLEVMSLAHGETKVAALNQVVVLRNVNGQKMGAVFDVASIRRNETPDPAILGNDIVIIGFSNARGLWADILTASPLLNTFVLLRR